MKKLFYKLLLRYYSKLKIYDTQKHDEYSTKYLLIENKLRGLKK
ncbi:hypothetical protein ACF5W4_11205 [Bacillota bacterium Lsc_1132]